MVLGRISGHQPNIQGICESKSEGCNGKLYKHSIYQEILIGKYMHNLGLNALHTAHRLCKCNAIWNHKKGIKQIPNHANMCAKFVLGKSKYDSASQTLQHLHWLLVRKGFITTYSDSHISASMDKHWNT